VLLRYISLSLFALLAACFPAALNSDVFFIICTFFAADLCLERKGSRRARKKEVDESSGKLGGGGESHPAVEGEKTQQ